MSITIRCAQTRESRTSPDTDVCTCGKPLRRATHRGELLWDFIDGDGFHRTMRGPIAYDKTDTPIWTCAEPEPALGQGALL